MGAYEVLKDAVTLAQKADNVDLLRRLLDVQKELLDLRAENQKLRTENTKLREAEEMATVHPAHVYSLFNHVSRSRLLAP